MVKEVKENSKMPRKKSENQDEVKCERKVETTTKEKKSPMKKSLASSSTSEKERTPVKATKNAHVNLKAKSSPEKQSYKVVASPIKVNVVVCICFNGIGYLNSPFPSLVHSFRCIWPWPDRSLG